MSVEDGTGRDSPFTTALLHHLGDSGLEVTFLFRIVRDEVMKATNGAQQPFVRGSLSKEAIYLKPPTADQLLATMPSIASGTSRQACRTCIAPWIEEKRLQRRQLPPQNLCDTGQSRFSRATPSAPARRSAPPRSLDAPRAKCVPTSAEIERAVMPRVQLSALSAPLPA